MFEKRNLKHVLGEGGAVKGAPIVWAQCWLQRPEGKESSSRGRERETTVI